MPACQNYLPSLNSLIYASASFSRQHPLIKAGTRTLAPSPQTSSAEWQASSLPEEGHEHGERPSLWVHRTWGSWGREGTLRKSSDTNRDTSGNSSPWLEGMKVHCGALRVPGLTTHLNQSTWKGLPAPLKPAKVEHLFPCPAVIQSRISATLPSLAFCLGNSSCLDLSKSSLLAPQLGKTSRPNHCILRMFIMVLSSTHSVISPSLTRKAM